MCHGQLADHAALFLSQELENPIYSLQQITMHMVCVRQKMSKAWQFDGSFLLFNNVYHHECENLCQRRDKLWVSSSSSCSSHPWDISALKMICHFMMINGQTTMQTRHLQTPPRIVWLNSDALGSWSLFENMTSSIKPEVHVNKASQCCWSRTKSDRAMAMGKAHTKFGEDWSRGSRDILADKQVNKLTNWSQYCAENVHQQTFTQWQDKVCFKKHSNTIVQVSQ